MIDYIQIRHSFTRLGKSKSLDAWIECDECLIKLGLVFAIHHGPGRFECITADPGSTTIKCLCECNNKYHSFTWEECKYVHRFSILGVSYYPETILRIGKEVSNNFR